MHRDIHYFGTYAMARAAGLQADICQTIATAAEFVDDNKENKAILFEDGGRFEIIPTAHPLVHIDNTKYFDHDQRTVWLPFHFLPGNEGKSVSERLVCQKNSAIAQKMIGHCLSLFKKPFGPFLVGIAAHVYADTFSHYGFSGVSSRWNKVDGNSIKLCNDNRSVDDENRFREKYGKTMDGLQNWRQVILDKLQSGAAEIGTGALGHGAVMKYPDYPYLKWKFSYEHPDGKQRTSSRNNLDTYLEACEKLHGLFCRIGKDYPDVRSDQGQEFDSIREAVTDILSMRETDREKRGNGWATTAAAKGRKLFCEPEEILPYQGKEWKKGLEKLAEDKEDSRSALGEPIFRFAQAAAVYRAYILRDLLPAYGLVMDQVVYS